MSEALQIAERIGDATLRARSVTYMTVICRRLRDPVRTRYWAQQTLAIAEAGDMLDYIGVAEASLAWVALVQQDAGETERRACVSLDAWSRLPPSFPYPLTWMARLPLVAVLADQVRFSEALVQLRCLLADEQALLPEPLATAVREAVTNEVSAERSCRHVVDAAREIGFI